MLEQAPSLGVVGVIYEQGVGSSFEIDGLVRHSGIRLSEIVAQR